MTNIEKARELCEEYGKTLGRVILQKLLDVTQSEARNLSLQLKLEDKNKEENGQKGNILVIGDAHAPFMHENYVRFLKDTYKKWGCDRVVCIGDLVDQHALSRHTSEPIADGAKLEYEKAMIQVKEVTDAFPEAYLTMGNHDQIVNRNARENGIPVEIFLKPFKEVYQLPKGWNVVESIILDGVVFEHGIGSCGKFGAFNSAIKERMSFVQGHQHSGGGVMYSANSRDIIFGLNVGCGIDTTAYAFAYGKTFKNKPTLGCGVVCSSSESYFVPMDLDGKYKKI